MNADVSLTLKQYFESNQNLTYTVFGDVKWELMTSSKPVPVLL